MIDGVLKLSSLNVNFQLGLWAKTKFVETWRNIFRILTKFNEVCNETKEEKLPVHPGSFKKL